MNKPDAQVVHRRQRVAIGPVIDAETRGSMMLLGVRLPAVAKRLPVAGPTLSLSFSSMRSTQPLTERALLGGRLTAGVVLLLWRPSRHVHTGVRAVLEPQRVPAGCPLGAQEAADCVLAVHACTIATIAFCGRPTTASTRHRPPAWHHPRFVIA